MKMVNIQAAKTHLSRLVEEAAAGGGNRPRQSWTSNGPPNALRRFKKPRKLGVLRGQIEEIEGCWKTDPELEKAFLESNLTPRISSTKVTRSKR